MLFRSLSLRQRLCSINYQRKVLTTTTRLNFKVGFDGDSLDPAIFVELSYESTAGNQPPPGDIAEKATPMTGKATDYDFQVRLDSALQLQEGWPIKTNACVPQLRRLLEDGELGGQAAVLGVLGYYSKGKTFLMNGIFEAGQKRFEEDVQGGMMRRLLGPPSRLADGTGPGVTTTGICGKFARGSAVEDSQLLLLDTPGRNAPSQLSTVKSEGNGDSAFRNLMSSMLEDIHEIRSKERLVDDMIMDVSDVIVYVVDEVLNEDQRTLVHFLKYIEKKKEFGKKLIIVHNFKRLNVDDENHTDRMVNEQVAQAMNATMVKGSPVKHHYRSKWPLQRDDGSFRPFPVKHFVLFNDNNEASRAHNNRVFNVFAGIADDAVRERYMKNPLDALAESASKHITNYVTFSPIDGDRDNNENHGQVQRKGTTCGEQADCIRITMPPHHVLEALQWELRDMPKPVSRGPFKPITNRPYVDDSTGERFWVVPIQLPGMNIDDLVVSPPEETGSEEKRSSWFRAKRVPSDFILPERKYVLEGYLRKKSEKDETTQCGHFHVEYAVPAQFDATGEVALEDGIFTHRFKDRN